MLCHAMSRDLGVDQRHGYPVVAEDGGQGLTDPHQLLNIVMSCLIIHVMAYVRLYLGHCGDTLRPHQTLLHALLEDVGSPNLE